MHFQLLHSLGRAAGDPVCKGECPALLALSLCKASQEVLVLKLLCVGGQFCTVVVTIVARVGLRVKRGSFV